MAMTQADSISRAEVSAAAVPASPSGPARHYVPAGNDSVPLSPAARHKSVSDSVAAPADSLASDSVAKPRVYGITLTPPKMPEVERNVSSSPGISIILGGLVILFCIIGLRFRNNRKYVTALLRNLVEVKVRNNLFDETVRETSFLVLLNLMWSCSAGIILYFLLDFSVPGNPAFSFGLPGLHSHVAASMAICMGVGVVYTCFMALAYYLVGTVFSDKVYARLWLKGFAASQGLLGFIYFPLALLFLCYPDWTGALLWVALATFVLAKIVFICKGFRIFFSQISSWVLFLYYLCSLEIVPLILTYLAATLLCGLLS